jgi:hypothetical protein
LDGSGRIFSTSKKETPRSKTCFENHRSNILFVMALSISSTSTMIFFKSPQFVNRLRVVKTKCESKEPPPEAGRPPAKGSKLEIGSPVIVIEAPKMIKTAASVPCLRVNSGLVNRGDVGRYSYYLSGHLPCNFHACITLGIILFFEKLCTELRSLLQISFQNLKTFNLE